jgi:membrane associated rhomboid family serine protease
LPQVVSPLPLFRDAWFEKDPAANPPAPIGIYPLVPLGVAWNGNNIGGSLKRGVGIAMHVGFGNLGGVVAAFVYQSKYAPR